MTEDNKRDIICHLVFMSREMYESDENLWILDKDELWESESGQNTYENGVVNGNKNDLQIMKWRSGYE